MKPLLLALALAALLAAACGSDDDSADTDDPLVQAIADALVADADPGDPFTDRAGTECFAAATVGRVGEDRLAELGITEESVEGDIDNIEFSDEELRTLVDTMDDCYDLEAFFADAMAADLGEEAADCLASELGSDALTDAMLAGFGDGDAATDEFNNAMLDAMAACDVPLN